MSKLREKIEKIFEEGEHEERKDVKVRLWPLLLWLFITELIAFYVSPLITQEYSSIMFIVLMVAIGAILFKPFGKMCVKKIKSDE